MISSQYEHGASAAIAQHHNWDKLDDQINTDEANAAKMEQGAAVARKYCQGHVLHLPGMAWGGHIIQGGKQVRTHE